MAERITIIINAQAEQAVKEFDAVSRGVMGAAEKVQQAGMRMSLGITLPLVAGAATAIRAAASWDTAMVGVAKTVDAPIERIERLGQEFVALSEAIPVASNELAGIGAQAGQLGIATESILGFTTTVAALSVSTNLTAESAGNALARMANIMGTSQGDFDRMGSVIVGLGNTMATTEAEITEFALRMAGAGRIAGFTEAEVFALGASLSSVGVQAEAGGTAMQKALITINTAVATGGAEVARFAEVSGMSSEEFVATWHDKPAQAFSAFVGGLKREGDLAASVLEELIAGDQRLARAFLSLANAGDLLSDATERGTKLWAENTAMTKEADKFYKRMAADFIVVANKATNVAAELGTGMAPAAKLAAGAAGGLLDVVRVGVQVFTALPAPIRTTAVGLVALTAAAGPAMLAVSGLMRAWALVTGMKAAQMAIPAITVAVTRLAVAVPTLTLVLRTLASTTVIGAVLTGVALLAAAFARADKVARDAADSWRGMLADVKSGIEGLGSVEVVGLFVGAQRQRDAAEEQLKKARADLAAVEAEFAVRREDAMPSQLGKLRREEMGRKSSLQLQIEDLERVLPGLRAKVAVLGPEFQRLQTEEFAAARAAADLKAELDKVAVGFGSTVRLSARELGDVHAELKQQMEGARKQLFTLETSQAGLAVGSDVWKDMGESIAKARTEMQLTESALARVTAELGRMAQAKIAAMDFTPRSLGNFRLGLPVPGAAAAMGVLPQPSVPGTTDENTGKFTPTLPSLSATTLMAAFATAQRQATKASEFGMSVEQFDLLRRAARSAGLSVEDYADALGIARQAQLDVTAITISGMGAIVAAFAGGMGQIEVTVVNAMTQIMQTLAQKDGPLGSIFGGFGVPVFGAIGGILAAVLSKRNDRQRVEVDQYSQKALEQQKQIQPGQQSVQVILVDSRGNEIRRVSSELRRLTALDGVTRLPDYAPVGG